MKPKLTLNTCTATEFTTLESTPTDTTDMPCQRSTAMLLPQSTLDTTESTTAYTTESTTPTLESTILASVMLKLTLNLSTTLMLESTILASVMLTPDTLV